MRGAAEDGSAPRVTRPVVLLPLLAIPFQDFIGCHDGSLRFHRPVLAIVGGTRLGKSMLAADILDRIARRLGLPGLCMVFGGGHGQKRIGYKPSV